MRTGIHPAAFLSAVSDPEKARFCLLGVPLDITVCFRPGTRRGPDAIRRMSWGLESYSLYQEKDLKDVPLADLGDLSLPAGGLTRSLQVIGAAVAELVEGGKVPFLLGGEHLLSLPAVRAAAAKYGEDLAVLQFDAHADLCDQYEGEELSHATVMRHIAQAVGPSNVYQLGIRSATAAEVAFARQTNFHPFQVLEPLKRIVPELRGRPVYLTLDIDVLDPAFAPGVGTPEPGGQTIDQMLAALRLLSGLNVVGLDLVEVSPPFDQSERTSILAALLVRELLLLL